MTDYITGVPRYRTSPPSAGGSIFHPELPFSRARLERSLTPVKLSAVKRRAISAAARLAYKHAFR